MGKRVTVMLFGKMMRKGVQVDADATEGAIVGRNLVWSDGSPVTEAQIRNQASTGGSGGGTISGNVAVTLWSLILNIPAIIKSLVALAKNGFIYNTAGVITAHDWTFVKNSVDTGESFTIPTARQLLVWDDFNFNGGNLTIDGELVVLGGLAGILNAVTNLGIDVTNGGVAVTHTP